MKKLFIIATIILMTASINAATLKWDASTGADGYNIYYTDGAETFNYNAGNVLEVQDIDNTLNLHPGTTYTFTATAYNQVGESPASESVDYTTEDIYTPPSDNLPIHVTKPSIITIIVE